MKLYGIRFARGFKYGTKESVFCTLEGNCELIPDFSFFYYLAEYGGKHFLIDTGFRDEWLAEDMGVTLLPIKAEISKVFGLFPEIAAIFLTHSHWDHINNIDLYPNAGLIMSKLTYEQAMAEGGDSVKNRLKETKAPISLVKEKECFYDIFHFEVIGGHTPDSSVLIFRIGNDTYCITGDECYFCENMERNIPIGIRFCAEKNELFMKRAYTEGWIPLPFHDAGILDKYNRLTENIVRIV